jgi:D-alanyl-D-alanine carboxypeptidase (penicillin-binding protein 5/6)
VVLGLLPAQGLAAPPPALQVRSAALIDASTGQSLYGMNAGAEVAIASATKLMTALVVLQHARLAQVLRAPAYQLAAVDSQIGLQAGEPMTVRDLLIAMMLPSADDAAYDLAYNVGGRSVSQFVAMMNTEAAQLGLSHTHYSTPVGLDTPGNHSTADDLVALARYLLRTEPFVRQVVAMPTAHIRVGGAPRTVSNLNGLVGRVPWVNGVKTGHTLDAGYVLVGSGHRDGLTLISAVLGASSESARESDTLALLNWGFANFRLVAPVTSGQLVASRPVRGRHGLRTALVASGSFSRVFPRSTRVTTVVHAPRVLSGPLRKGAITGTLTVMAGSAPVGRIPLRLRQAVPAPPSSLSLTTIARPFTLVLLVVLLGVAVVKGRRERLTARRAASQQQE